jgi:hypothetical protein
MTLKAKLVAELGEEKANQILSNWGREMRSKVKGRTGFNSERGSNAAKIRWAKYKKDNETRFTLERGEQAIKKRVKYEKDKADSQDQSKEA